MGLHQAVALCMDHCRDAELMGDDAWFKTVVLTGGTACLPGLAGRIIRDCVGDKVNFLVQKDPVHTNNTYIVTMHLYVLNLTIVLNALIQAG